MLFVDSVFLDSDLSRTCVIVSCKSAEMACQCNAEMLTSVKTYL